MPPTTSYDLSNLFAPNGTVEEVAKRFGLRVIDWDQVTDLGRLGRWPSKWRIEYEGRRYIARELEDEHWRCILHAYPESAEKALYGLSYRDKIPTHVQAEFLVTLGGDPLPVVVDVARQFMANLADLEGTVKLYACPTSEEDVHLHLVRDLPTGHQFLEVDVYACVEDETPDQIDLHISVEDITNGYSLKENWVLVGHAWEGGKSQVDSLQIKHQASVARAMLRKGPAELAEDKKRADIANALEKKRDEERARERAKRRLAEASKKS